MVSAETKRKRHNDENKAPRKSSRTRKQILYTSCVSSSDSESELFLPVSRSDTGTSLNGSTDQGDETGEMSEYELKVQQNKDDRLKFLQSLQMDEDKQGLMNLFPVLSNKPKPMPKKEPSINKNPTRRSGRIANAPVKLPDADDKLPEVWYEQPQPRRIKDGPLMSYLAEGYNSARANRTLAFSSDQQQTLVSDSSCWGGDAANVIKVLNSLHLQESHVGKVLTARITSLIFHPTSDTTLLIAGSKTGDLSIWDVENTSGLEDCGYFKIHSLNINRLTMDASDPKNIISTSYDGSTRLTDLHKQTVTELFSVPEFGYQLTWHSQVDASSLLISSTSGDVVRVDMRSRGSECMYNLDTKRAIKLVSVNPITTHYFVSSNAMGTVCLWDLRLMKKFRPISCITPGRSASNLCFSPVTGRTLLMGSADDALRLLIHNNFTRLSVLKSMHHRNQTGRWLSTFKPEFLPGREDLFIVGSLAESRIVEVWDVHGKLRKSLRSEWMTTVCSLVAVHPTRPLVAGGNSTGKCHVFVAQ